MVSSDADHRSYQRRRPLQALRWRERRSCHLSLGSRCPACEEASVKVACRRVRGRRRPQRPVPGANDGALAANTQCQPAEARTSPPALARPSPDTNDEALSKSRTSRPQQATARHERQGPLKVEDVAARARAAIARNERRGPLKVEDVAAQSRGRRRPRRATARHERRGPLKVEDVAAHNRPPPVTNDEARSKSRTSPPATGHRPSRTTRPASS